MSKAKWIKEGNTSQSFSSIVFLNKDGTKYDMKEDSIVDVIVKLKWKVFDKKTLSFFTNEENVETYLQAQINYINYLYKRGHFNTKDYENKIKHLEKYLGEYLAFTHNYSCDLFYNHKNNYA
jgi:hypothetical protein